jgi:hypothetical protein
VLALRAASKYLRTFFSSRRSKESENPAIYKQIPLSGRVDGAKTGVNLNSLLRSIDNLLIIDQQQNILLNDLINRRSKLRQFHDHDNTPLNIMTQYATKIFMECCKRKKVHALILSLEEIKVYYHAWIVWVSGNLLCLHLTRKLIITPAPGSSCYISFTYQNRSFSFFSNVFEYRHNFWDKHTELILNISSGIMRSGPNLGCQVNVLPGSQFVVNLITDAGIILSPGVRDLSLIGIGIEFTRKSAKLKLEVGSFVEVEMRLPPDEVRLKGVVRHRIGLKYIIFFPTVVTKYGVKPPPALINIVSALEREGLCEIEHA